MVFDLHIHTNVSDGKLSPEDVVDEAVERDLDVIAITDHDNLGAIPLARNYIRKNNYNIKLIPGIEFGCSYRGEEVHILGYFIDYKDEALNNRLNKLREARNNRVYKIVDRLQSLGLDINLDEFKIRGEESIGRPHIARILIKKGYVSTIKEAFDIYLAKGGKAFVEREKLSVEETIKLIKKAGGTSILAHPGLLKDSKLVEEIIGLGIDGLECIHSEHTEEESEFFEYICKREEILITAGSDCHGELIGGDLLMGNYNLTADKWNYLKIRRGDKNDYQ